VRHWFDTGLAPRFCAIRFFTIADGWVARFTGDRVAGRFDAYAGSAA
jgi:1,2-dihydroxy-3-keto-5-methylthiopentene dioxygenase